MSRPRRIALLAAALLAAPLAACAGCRGDPLPFDEEDAGSLSFVGGDEGGGGAPPDAGAGEGGEAPAGTAAKGAGKGNEEEEEAAAAWKYGLVHRFSVSVYDKPSTKGRLIGALRKGNVLPVVEEQEKGGCGGGWLYLPKGGGHACRDHGVRVVKEPFNDGSVSLHAPWFDALLPYDYGRIGKDDLPAYNKMPSADEEKQVEGWLAERRALLVAQAEAVKKAMEEGTPVPNPYEPIQMEVGGEEGKPAQTVETKTEWSQEVEGGPVPTKIPFPFVQKILLHGFFVSVGRKVYAGGHSWVETARGLLVPGDSIHTKHPPTTKGIELDEDSDLPVVLVRKGKAGVLKMDEAGKLKGSGTQLQRFDAAAVKGELESGGARFLRIGADTWVNARDVTVVEKTKPPQIIKTPAQKWIDVDVSRQVLTAYEGTKAVYVAFVSTGKEKVSEEFKTPRGVHAILSKHVTSTMDNLYASDGPYMIEDVPWTMYFLGSYAIHGAFWHNGFGAMRSHGCINLPPFDARWLLYWADPQLPEGWHSVYASAQNPGTVVVVRD